LFFCANIITKFTSLCLYDLLMLVMCFQGFSLTPSLSLPVSLLLSSILPRSPSLCSYKCIFYVTERRRVEVTIEKCWRLNSENWNFDKCIKYVWQLLDTMGVHHVTSNVPITYYFPSVHNMYMWQGLSSDCNNIGFCV